LCHPQAHRSRKLYRTQTLPLRHPNSANVGPTATFYSKQQSLDRLSPTVVQEHCRRTFAAFALLD
jgi:hypothetical protein